MAKTETPPKAIWTYTPEGGWQAGDPKILSARAHSVWLGSAVFDGARAIAGKLPDLDRHCARVIRSAEIMGLKPGITAKAIAGLVRDGVAKFPADAALYICPLFYAEDGFVLPEPETTGFVLSIFDAPLPEPKGFSALLSPYRRPARDMAPTEAKASCLYPNVARSVRVARAQGFDTAVMLDPVGNVAEFAYANLFAVMNGEVHTPQINGTFLNGITRQRVITLLRGAGVNVIERAMTYGELATADELFSTGNYLKVSPCTRLDARTLQPGPLFQKAYDLYFEFVRNG